MPGGRRPLGITSLQFPETLRTGQRLHHRQGSPQVR